MWQQIQIIWKTANLYWAGNAAQQLLLIAYRKSIAHSHTFRDTYTSPAVLLFVCLCLRFCLTKALFARAMQQKTALSGRNEK